MFTINTDNCMFVIVCWCPLVCIGSLWNQNSVFRPINPVLRPDSMITSPHHKIVQVWIFESHTTVSLSHLDLDCRTMRRWVSFFESILTVHRCGSHNQAARCVKHLEFYTCSCQTGRASDNFLRMSDVNESLRCSMEVCSADVVVFQLQWQTLRHHDWDKHLAFWIHRLVYSRLRQYHPINIFWMYIISRFLRPNSCFIDLLWWAPKHGDWLCHEPLHESGLAVNTWSSGKYPSLTSAECSSFFLDWFTLERGFWHKACNLSNCSPRIIIFILFTKFLQNRLH